MNQSSILTIFFFFSLSYSYWDGISRISTYFDWPHRNKQACTALPFDQHYFVADQVIYEWSYVENSFVGNFSQFTMSPVSVVPNVTLDACFVWSIDRLYCFDDTGKYFRFDDNMKISHNPTVTGWPLMPLTLDSFVTLNDAYSIAFKDDQFYVYDNSLDIGAQGDYPMPINRLIFDFPEAVTDTSPADEFFFHPYLGSLVMFHESQEYHFDWVNGKMLPGYPRPLGTGGATCSGSHDMSSFLGWVSDRRDLNNPATYAAGQDCHFRIYAPYQLLRTIGPFYGIWVKFFDFDLAAGDWIEIWEENDMVTDPNIIQKEMMHFTTISVRQAPISFPSDHVPRRVLVFDNQTRPVLHGGDPVNSFYIFSNATRSISVRFHSDDDPSSVARGFKLLYGMVGRGDEASLSANNHNAKPAPSINAYTDVTNVAVTQSIFRDSVQIIMLRAPFDKSSHRMHVLWTPYTSEAAGQFNITISTRVCGSDNITTELVNGIQIWQERSTFLSPSFYKERPTQLSCGVNFTLHANNQVAVMMATTYTSYADCGGLVQLSQPAGIVEDGSGPNSFYSSGMRCAWLISPDPSDVDVLFVTAQIIWSQTSDEADALKFYDGNSSDSNLLATYSGLTTKSLIWDYAMNINGAQPPQRILKEPRPFNSFLLSSSGRDLFVTWESSPQFSGQGWSFQYELINRPVLSTLQVNWACFDVVGASSSPSIKYPLAINGTLVAGQDFIAEFTAADKNGRPTLFELTNWFRKYVRFIPITFSDDQKHALFSFPGKLADAFQYASVWETKGITAAMLQQILELETEGLIMAGQAPLRAGYYDMSFAVLVASLSTWPSSPDNATYTSYFFHSLPPAHYTTPKRIVVVPAQLITTHTQIVSRGAKYDDTIIAGTTRSFLLKFHDEYWNLLDHGDLDVRVFGVSSHTEQSSSISIRIADNNNGTYRITFTPTIANLYDITIIVGGADVPGSPFPVLVVPALKTVAEQTRIEAFYRSRDGVSVQTSQLSVLPLAIPITFVVSLRDEFGNLRLESNDLVTVALGDIIVASRRPVTRGTLTFQYTFRDFQIGSISFALNDDAQRTAATIIAGQTILQQFVQNDVLFYAAVALSILGGCLCCLCFWFILSFRSDVRIKAASPNFLFLIVLGCLLEYGVVPLLAIYPVTDAICQAIPFLGHFGFWLCFGALFIKTWRIMSIFNRRTLNVLSLSDTNLMVRLSSVLILLFLYLIIWAGVSPPHTTPFEESAGSGKYLINGVSCSSDVAWFPNLALIFEAIALGYGVFLASQVRKTPDQFNEAPKIAFCIHELFGIGGILILLDRFVLTDQEMIMILETISVWGLTTITLLAFFGPSIYQLVILAQSAPDHSFQVQVNLDRSRLDWDASLGDVAKGFYGESGTRARADARLHESAILSMVPIAHKNQIVPLANFSHDPALSLGYVIADKPPSFEIGTASANQSMLVTAPTSASPQAPIIRQLHHQLVLQQQEILFLHQALQEHTSSDITSELHDEIPSTKRATHLPTAVSSSNFSNTSTLPLQNDASVPGSSFAESDDSSHPNALSREFHINTLNSNDHELFRHLT